MVEQDNFFETRHVENLKDLLEQSVKLYPENIAFKIKNKETGEIQPILYKEFKQNVDELGTVLLKKGFKNEKIAIISENRYEWAITYFSIVNGNGIVVPLDKALPDNEIEGLLERAKVTAIFFSKSYYNIMLKVSKRNPRIKLFICMDDLEQTNKFKTMNCLMKEGNEFLINGERKFIDAKIDNDKMKILLFTSGTTDTSKAVMLSHKNICNNVIDVFKTFKLYSTDTFFSFLPIHHTFECTCGFLCAIYAGASIAYCRGLRYIMKDFEEFKPTAMVTVPLILENVYKKVWDKAKKEGMENKLRMGMQASDVMRKYFNTNLTKRIFKDVHNIFGGDMRLIISGAAALDPKVEKDFQSMGINLAQGYGLTETSPVISASGDNYRRIGSAGKPLPSVEVKINKPDEDGVGEILVKSPSVMLGYYENEEETKEVLKKGWFYTGDLGYLDKDGYLFVTGRKKSVIVQKNGKNIYPEELEAIINKILYVKESFIFAKEVRNGALNICAKIVFDKEKVIEDFGEDFDINKIENVFDEGIKELNKKMPIYKHIREVIVTDKELQKTTTKKIKRHIEMNKVKEMKI